MKTGVLREPSSSRSLRKGWFRSRLQTTGKFLCCLGGTCSAAPSAGLITLLQSIIRALLIRLLYHGKPLPSLSEWMKVRWRVGWKVEGGVEGRVGVTSKILIILNLSMASVSSVTATFRITIIALMIFSGAINTIGKEYPTQPTSSKTSRWSSRDSSSNISSTPTCRYLPPHPGHDYVLRLGPRFPHLPLHEKKRP